MSLSDEYPFQGAKRTRSSTDVLGCFLFVLVACSSFAVGIYGYAHGDMRLLVEGSDFHGCRCGTHSTFSESEQKCVQDSSAPKLGNEAAFVLRINSKGKIVSGAEAVTVCTESCPSKVEWLCVDGSSFGTLQDAVDDYGSIQAVAANCGRAYPSSSAGPYCLPDEDYTGPGADDYNQAVGKSRRGHAVGAVVRALKDAGWVYIVAAVSAVALGYAYIKLVQHCALPMALVGMATIVAGFCAAGAMVYTSTEPSDSEAQVRQKHIVGGVLVGFAAFLVLLYACLWKRIVRAVEMVKLASQCLMDLPSLPFVPLAVAPFFVLVLVFWTSSTAFLTSTGLITNPGANSTVLAVEDSVGVHPTTRNLIIYQVFTLLWSLEFLSCFAFMVIATAAGAWYFKPTTPTEDHPDSSTRAWALVTRYHLGTVAVGSLLIAVCSILRALARNQARRNRRGPAAVVAACMYCITACIDRCVRYISRHALIMTALHGTSFCTSGMRAVKMIVRNILLASGVSLVVKLFVLIGTLMVTSVTVAISFALLTRLPEFRGTDPTVPCAVVAVEAFLIARLFMMALHVVIDTIFMSIVEDEEVTRTRGRTGACFGRDYIHRQVDQLKAEAMTYQPAPLASSADDQQHEYNTYGGNNAVRVA